MLTLLLILPLSPIHDARCEVGERNAFHDCDGNPTFDQMVFWREHVDDWRLLAKCGEPEYDHARRSWSNIWVENGVIYRVRYPVLKRSITVGVDPELADRESLPKDQRRGLR